MSMSELPEDLFTEILRRFTIKDICQFKCVSKPWNCWLSSPRFARSHLEFHKDGPKQLIITASWSENRFDPSYYIATLTDFETTGDADSTDAEDGSETSDAAAMAEFETICDIDSTEDADDESETSDAAAMAEFETICDTDSTEDADDESETSDAAARADFETTGDAGDGVVRKAQFPVEHEPLLAGSCDGLVLLELQNAESSKILFNPITLETANVLDNRGDFYNPCVYGFGYDSNSKDYKIVSLSKLTNGSGSLVDVYSLKMKSWRRIANTRYILQNSPYTDQSHKAPGVFLNGCLHWLGSATYPPKHGYEIVCFDLAREEFVEVPIALDRVFELARECFEDIPNLDNRRVPFDISVIDGCLALSMLPSCITYQWLYVRVWVMKEYGVQDSWVEIANMMSTYHDRTLVKAVCDLNEDEILVAGDNNHLCAYDLRNKGWRRMYLDGLPYDFHTVLPFKGSLMSPN